MPINPPLTAMATLRWSVVRPIVQSLAPSRIFEVGCGQGSFGARLARMTSYVGVEPDDQSYRVAQERIAPHGGRVLRGLPDTGEGQFDMLCAFEVLEHIEDDTAALSDWLTRLRPGGTVILSVPAWPDRFSAMDTRVGHYRRYTPAAIAAVLQRAGCVNVQTTLYGWPLGYCLEAVRARLAARKELAQSADMSARSASSGRLYQPAGAVGTAVRLVVAPFAHLQRLRPDRGVGLIAVGMLPA